MKFKQKTHLDEQYSGIELVRSRRRDDRRRSGEGRIPIPTKTADSMPTMTPGQTDAASSNDAVIQAVATFQIPELLVWFPIAVKIHARIFCIYDFFGISKVLSIITILTVINLLPN